MPRPCLRSAGTVSASTSRTSRFQWIWSATNPAKSNLRATVTASSTSAESKLEQATCTTLPDACSCMSASRASSTGASGSG